MIGDAPTGDIRLADGLHRGLSCVDVWEETPAKEGGSVSGGGVILVAKGE